MVPQKMGTLYSAVAGSGRLDHNVVGPIGVRWVTWVDDGSDCCQACAKPVGCFHKHALISPFENNFREEIISAMAGG